MPPILHMPGVAIEQAPALPGPLVAQPTSVALFVGRTRRGPVGLRQPVRSLREFERLFGPAPAGDTLAAAVSDFFANGGSQAQLLRLYRPVTPPADAAPPAAHPDGCARWSVGGLRLRAADPGRWGQALQLQLKLQAADASLFDLSIEDTACEAVEQFTGLSLQPGHPMEAGPWLEARSRLVRLDAPLPADPIGSGTGELLRPGDDGEPLTAAALIGDAAAAGGLLSLAEEPPFHLLCLPPPDDATDWPPAVWAAAARLARQARAVLLIDPPASWRSARDAVDGARHLCAGCPDAALYFPRLAGPGGGRVPCGAVAGVIARTDRERGVWKAPAGLDASLRGAPGLTLALNDDQIGLLHAQAVNSLRPWPDRGTVVWGARTRDGMLGRSADFQYLPVRRLVLHIEDSLLRGLAWAVFEPNAEPLWAQLRLQAGSFMEGLFRQGAFQGSVSHDAYFVRCDGSTTHADDQRRGVVRLLVGLAPVRPAEFLLLRLALQTQPVNPD